MSAQLMTPKAKRYTADDIFQPPTEEAADAARHYLAYSGPYELFEQDSKPVLKHHIDLSLAPNWAGHHQLRRCEWEGDELVLGPVSPWSINVSVLGRVPLGLSW